MKKSIRNAIISIGVILAIFCIIGAVYTVSNMNYSYSEKEEYATVVYSNKSLYNCKRFGMVTNSYEYNTIINYNNNRIKVSTKEAYDKCKSKINDSVKVKLKCKYNKETGVTENTIIAVL